MLCHIELRPTEGFRIADCGFLRMWSCERLLCGLWFLNPKFECRNPKFAGARGEIRTHHRADLKSAASAIWATRAMILSWYSRRDSNPHCTVFETVVSCRLDYASNNCIDENEEELSVTSHWKDVVTFSIRPGLAGRVGFEPTHLLIENQAA